MVLILPFSSLFPYSAAGNTKSFATNNCMLLTYKRIFLKTLEKILLSFDLFSLGLARVVI